MDKYIILSFQKDFLVFSQTNEILSPNNVINSNKVYHDKLIYSYKYFKRNNEDILNLINKNLVDRKIHKAYVEDYRLVDETLKFIKLLKINSYFSKNFKSLTINQCNLILNNKNLNYVNSFYIPNEYLYKMLRSRKKVHINYLESISNDFMISQDCIDSEALYYKKVLHFDEDYYYKTKDLVEFLKLNIYLKTIHLHFYNKSILENIISCLKKDNRNNIVILLYQGKNDFISNNFKYLKDINGEYKKELNGEIRIIYNQNYIKNNLFKQLTYNNIKMSLVIVFYVLLVAMVFTGFYNYASKLNLDKLNYELYINTMGSSLIYSSEEESVTKEVIDKYTLENSFNSLLNINSDTIGWLKVNNTNINYPVVQARDNNYYLKRDFYKDTTSSGWIFMDSRNSTSDLDDNTIIYGHNLKNGLMFGTLYKVYNSSWYKDKENQIISFNSLNKNMKWQIFSIYKTEISSTYLTTNFAKEDEFNKFVEILKSKSIHDFKVNLQSGDKILTLSTCTGRTNGTQRLIVHAKLID